MITVETEGKPRNIFSIDEAEKAITEVAKNVFYRRNLENCTFVYLSNNLAWYSSKNSPRVGIKGSFYNLKQEIALVFKNNAELLA